MDWSKAKTILIVAFLVTNILLGLVLFSEEKQEEPTIKQSFIEDVIEILGKKDIFLDTEISKEIPKLNTLNVEYEILSIDRINRDFFNGEGKSESNEKDVLKISKDSEAITIFNKKILRYENYNQKSLYKDLNKDKAKAIALEFLEDKNFKTSDMKLSFVKENNSSYILDFSKIYNERYLEIAYTTIEIDNSGVRTFERLWLNPLSEGDTPIYISTAPKSILDLLSMEEVQGKTIIDISLCYYFEPSDYIEEPKDAREGKSIPAWRVLFQDGYKVIIDTY